MVVHGEVVRTDSLDAPNRLKLNPLWFVGALRILGEEALTPPSGRTDVIPEVLEIKVVLGEESQILLPFLPGIKLFWNAAQLTVRFSLIAGNYNSQVINPAANTPSDCADLLLPGLQELKEVLSSEYHKVLAVI